MKKLFFLLIITSLISCKEKFNPKEFKGTWIPLDKDSSYSNLPAITFQNDTAYFENMYSYNASSKYNIKKKSITWFFQKDTFENTFSFNKKDSTFILNNTTYFFYKGYSYGNNFIKYDLIDLDIGAKISSDSLLNFNGGFHLFKNNHNEIKLKLNDKTTSDFNLIPRFSFRFHSESRSMVIFIGKKVKLKDIIRCYHQLYSVNINEVFLLTQFDIEKNNYRGFHDIFHFWDFQRNFFSKERIEIPRPYNTKSDYLEKHNSKIIKINSKDDFEKIDRIKKENNYLISINPKLSIKDYIRLKEKLFKVNKNIRTEFNLEKSKI